MSSGGCSNFLGGDASQNTYTGRGSGTSYATPSVSGVIALIMEANENLTPLQIKEVLKQTAERRGEPSATDVDPYWNRDFGYGMVDALAAVELAIHLRESGQTLTIDPSLQNHLLSVSTNSSINITGHSWGQSGSIDRVEYRIDGGSWQEVTYSVVPSDVGALTPFEWHILLNPKSLSSASHKIEVHAVSGESSSLPVFANVVGTEGGESASGIPAIAIGFVALVALTWVSSLVLIRFRSDDEIDDMISNIKNRNQIDDVVEAELIE